MVPKLQCADTAGGDQCWCTYAHAAASNHSNRYISEQCLTKTIAHNFHSIIQALTKLTTQVDMSQQQTLHTLCDVHKPKSKHITKAQWHKTCQAKPAQGMSHIQGSLQILLTPCPTPLLTGPPKHNRPSSEKMTFTECLLLVFGISHICLGAAAQPLQPPVYKYPRPGDMGHVTTRGPYLLTILSFLALYHLLLCISNLHSVALGSLLSPLGPPLLSLLTSGSRS